MHDKVLLHDCWKVQHNLLPLLGEIEMTTWVQLTKEHNGQTAGAVLTARGTSFVPNQHRLVVLFGNENEAVACDPDDTLKPDDVALGVISLPDFIRPN